MEKQTKNPGWTGRADYEERRQNRIDRLNGAATREESAADMEFSKAHDLVKDIPFGQPNIVGRPALPRLRERSWNATERGMRHSERAERYTRRAEAAENNTAISSDDPAALEKLREKLKAMQDRQDFMKQVNAYYRKHKTLDGSPLSEAARKNIEGHWAQGWYRDIPFPPYELSNNNANMKRVKERIADLERRQSEPAPEGWSFDGGTVEANVEENRLQIFFDSIPDEEIRVQLKSNGFRWARSVGAWQRQLTQNAIYAAKRICKPVAES